MKYTFSRFSAFTLIELLVTITIIGILSTLSLGPIKAAQRKTRDSQRKADLSIIAQGIDAYYADQRSYPAYSPSCWSLNSTSPDPWIPGLSSYIPSTQGKAYRVPRDPKNNSTYNYIYTCSATASFKLQAKLENSSDPEATGGLYIIER